MKPVKIFAMLILLASSPATMAASSGGLPSKPTFHKITIDSDGPSAYVGNAAADAFLMPNMQTFALTGARNGNMHLYVNNNVSDATNGGAIIWQFLRTNSGTGASRNMWDMRITANQTTAGGDWCWIGADDAGATGTWYSFNHLCLKRIAQTVEIGTTLTSTKSCGSFTRADPNVCYRGSGVNALANVGTCVDVGGAATGATGRRYELDVQLYSNNAAGARNVEIGFYTDSGCTTNVATFYYAGYEYSAVAANTLIHRTTVQVETDRDHRYAKIVSKTGGSSTNVIVYSRGYKD